MVDLSASTIILEYICPGLGVLICQFMFSAPYHDLQRAVAQGEMGDLNPTPWALMLGNCFGWVAYGILTDNLFIFWANAPGFLLSVYLNLGAVKLLYQRHHSTEMRKSFVAFLKEEKADTETIIRQTEESSSLSEVAMRQQEQPEQLQAKTLVPSKEQHWATVVWNVTSQTTPAPAAHETLVLVVVTNWTIIMSILGFAQSLDSHSREFIVGTVVNLNLVFFYGAPLSTIYKVLQQGNSSSIHIRTMVTNTLNGIFWLAYGLAVLDPFVYVPNGLGALLGGIQVVLIVLYPRKASTATVDIMDEQAQVEEKAPEMKLPLTQKGAISGLELMDLDVDDTRVVGESEEGVPRAASTDGSSSAEAETVLPL